MGSRAPASKSGRACPPSLWTTKPNQTKPPSCTNQSNMCLERHQELRRTTEKKPRKLLRPRLPRKITATCKINLNKFWEELEEVYRDTSTAKVADRQHGGGGAAEQRERGEGEDGGEAAQRKAGSLCLPLAESCTPLLHTSLSLSSSTSAPLLYRASESQPSLPLEPLLVMPVCDSITCYETQLKIIAINCTR